MNLRNKDFYEIPEKEILFINVDGEMLVSKIGELGRKIKFIKR